MKRILLVLLMQYVVSVFLFAQQQEMPAQFATPNAASLGLYGDYPVSHFTGIPEINIPITTINTHDLALPIGLSYHAAAVRLKSHPGWVGLGWSLPVGGVISRTVRGIPDELQSVTGKEHGFYGNWQHINRDDWNTRDALESFADIYFLPSSTAAHREAQADHFSFNFMGYSGSFYLTHEGEWEVISNDPIQVEFDEQTGFLNANELRNDMFNKMSSTARVQSNRYFNKFTLIAPDGFRYEFGGVDATEYSVPYRAQQLRVTADSWYLTKITSPVGNTITFTYEPDDPVYSLSQSYNATKYGQNSSGWLENNCSTTASSNGYAYGGFLSMPVYLRRIEYDGGKIEFHRSSTVELDYPPNYYWAGIQVAQFRYGQPNEHEWKKLDYIEVFHKNEKIEKYQLNYTNTTDDRLKLTSINRIPLFDGGQEGTSLNLYQFDYYTDQLLPSYGSDEMDHWGFFNNSGYTFTFNGNQWIENFIAAKEPDVTGVHQQREVLKKITFPTGGHTIFEYEPHTYSREVLIGRVLSDFFTANKVAGGLRIKRIKTYASETDANYQTKEYFYNTGYSPSNPSTVSSGIVGNIPQYHWPDYQGTTARGNTFWYDRFSTGAILPFGLNSQGSHIGYSEVTVVEGEANSNHQGYTKYKFTNFGEDIWGITHNDEDAMLILETERSAFTAYADKAFERGLPIYQGIFDASNNLLSETTMKYEATKSAYLRGIDLGFVQICQSAGDHAFFGAAYKIYNVHFNVIEQTNTVIENNIPLIQKEIFAYDDLNNLKKTVEGIQGSDERIETQYFYPKDYQASSGLFNQMVQQNIVSPLVKLERKKDNQLIHAERNTFTYGSFLKEYTYRTNTTGVENSNIHIREKHNNKGELIEISQNGSTPNAIYWDSEGLLPIARIKNAYHNQVYYNSFELDGTPSSHAYTGQHVASSYQLNISGFPSGNYLMSYWEWNGSKWEYKEEKVFFSGGTLNRSFPNTIDELRIHPVHAQLTSYTYDHKGRMISECGINGQVVHFEYDGFNRLTKLRDHEGNLLKSYQYKYHNEN